VAKAIPPVDISHEDAHTSYGTPALRTTYESASDPEAGPETNMVVDLKKLSDSLSRSSPEEDLRRDLQRIIRARKPEIEATLASGQSYVLRVPDGRRIRISPKTSVEQVAVAG
jgi:hypothetical protein